MADLAEMLTGLGDWSVGVNDRPNSKGAYVVHLEFDDPEIVRRWATVLIERMPDDPSHDREAPIPAGETERG